MRDVIERIVATEAEAKRAIEEARAEADGIMAEARKKAQDITARAHQEAAAEADRIVASTVEEAEKEKVERLVLAAAKLEKNVGIDEAARKRIVEGIVRCICKP